MQYHTFGNVEYGDRGGKGNKEKAEESSHAGHQMMMCVLQ